MHVSHCLPVTPGRQKHWPVKTWQVILRDPVLSQLQGSQPLPLSILKYPSWQLSQLRPLTNGLQLHSPENPLQSGRKVYCPMFVPWFVPSGKHWQGWQLGGSPGFFKAKASPKNPDLHFSQRKPSVLSIHFKHSPVKPSQFPMALGSTLLLQSHFWQGLMGPFCPIGSPK